MKTLISEYAGAVIAVFVGIGVLGLILSVTGKESGVLGVAGEVIEVQTKDFLQAQEYGAYDTYLGKKSLSIAYVEENPIYAGEEIKVEEHFAVTDDQGNSVTYEVAEVYDHAGQGCKEAVMTQGGKLQFLYSGVYQILIETRQEDGKNVSALIAFPVRERWN